MQLEQQNNKKLNQYDYGTAQNQRFQRMSLRFFCNYNVVSIISIFATCRSCHIRKFHMIIFDHRHNIFVNKNCYKTKNKMKYLNLWQRLTLLHEAAIADKVEENPSTKPLKVWMQTKAIIRQTSWIWCTFLVIWPKRVWH